LGLWEGYFPYIGGGRMTSAVADGDNRGLQQEQKRGSKSVKKGSFLTTFFIKNVKNGVKMAK
jgi:hypothetical protein